MKISMGLGLHEHRFGITEKVKLRGQLEILKALLNERNFQISTLLLPWKKSVTRESLPGYSEIEPI